MALDPAFQRTRFVYLLYTEPSRSGGIALAVAGPSGLAFYRGNLIPEFRNNLLMSADQGRYLLRIRFDEREPARIVSVDRLLQDRVGGLRAVAVAPNGSIYVCTADSLLRLILSS